MIIERNSSMHSSEENDRKVRMMMHLMNSYIVFQHVLMRICAHTSYCNIFPFAGFFVFLFMVKGAQAKQANED